MRKQNKVENIEQCAKQQERAKKVLKDLEDNSKKASPEIIQYCKNIDKTFNGFSTYVKCWEFIAEYHKLWGNLETNNNKKSRKTIFILEDDKEKKIKEFEYDNWEAYINGDWNWSLIYDDVLNYIIKKYKKHGRKKK